MAAHGRTLRAALVKHKDAVRRSSFTESLMTYALGRRVESWPTMPAVPRPSFAAAAAATQRMSAFVLGVVNSRARSR